jgi:patatin-like phospholipase/acyl hydrolase
MAELRKILSIDGGGIRGIIPAMVLEYLERETDQSCSNIFDLIAGTSTGGILALGLTIPNEQGNPKYRAEDLTELYFNEGPHIFSRSKWYEIKSFGNISDAKYPSKGIEEVLDEYFGDSRLKDAITDVLITSYEIERRRAWFFKSHKARQPDLTGDFDFAMKDVARATSAAPTYFDPERIPANDDDSDYYAMVDGGVFANNPALCAYVEAKNLYPDDDIMVVSLGTGELTRRIAYNEAKDWGLAEWAKPVIDVMFDGVADTVDYQLKHILPHDHYFRFQIRLNEGMDDMDDTSQTNMRVLKLITEDLLRREKSKLNDLVNLINPS